MNRLLSLSIFLALAQFFAVAQTRVYYDAEILGADMSFTVDSEALSTVIEARCALTADKMIKGHAQCWWGLAWNYADEDNYDYVRLQSKSTDFGDLLDRRVMVLTVGKVVDGVDSVADSVCVEKDVGSIRGAVSVAVEWRDECLNLFFGAKSLAKVLSCSAPRPSQPHAGLISEGRLDVEYVVVESEDDPSKVLHSGWTEQALRDHFSLTADRNEGWWGFFDRETDDYRARLGGRYRLACVADGRGDYLLLYVDGAEVNASAWKPMMIKGRLLATRYENNYDLKWYDSMMKLMSDEDYASFDPESGLLTLNFPIHKSRLRLSKIQASERRF